MSTRVPTICLGTPGVMGVTTIVCVKMKKVVSTGVPKCAPPTRLSRRSVNWYQTTPDRVVRDQTVQDR